MFHDHRARKITNAIQSYDAELYAKDDGRAIRIYRKGKEYRQEQLTFQTSILNLVRNDHLVMSLTDTWGISGKRVDWGIEPIMARIRALDLWQNQNMANQFFEQEEKFEKSKEREFRNNVESFLYDFKSTFAKSMNDVNTSNLSKKINKRIGV